VDFTRAVPTLQFGYYHRCVGVIGFARTEDDELGHSHPLYSWLNPSFRLADKEDVAPKAPDCLPEWNEGRGPR